MDIAKEMIRESLPIKCLEAVILGMYPFLGVPRENCNDFLMPLLLPAHHFFSSTTLSSTRFVNGVINDDLEMLFSN